eukprot:3941776-Rhodomonas_salina.4
MYPGVQAPTRTSAHDYKYPSLLLLPGTTSSSTRSTARRTARVHNSDSFTTPGWKMALNEPWPLTASASTTTSTTTRQ